jgi:hypothetical protein
MKFAREKLCLFLLLPILVLITSCAGAPIRYRSVAGDPSRNINVDYAKCSMYGQNMVAGQQPYVTPGPDPVAALGQAIGGAMLINENRQQHIDQCMMASGWKRDSSE